eukprot:s8096_g3.t1
MKRLPPSSGIEIAAGIGDAPQVVPRREQGQEEDELKDYSPSQVAASDPPSDDEQDENEDPGEGQMGSSSSSSSRGQGVSRRRSERSDGSEEMIPDSGGAPPTSPKRNLERGGEPEAVHQRLDEGTTEVEEKPEKFIAVGEPSSTVRRVIAARSVKKIEPFLGKELPKYHDDEEVDLDEFEDVEAEIEEDEWWRESDGEEETPEGMPTWSNDFESGPPKLEGVASTVKLLSALFTSSEGYSLGSIDVGDAYLLVEQEEPTVVEVDGEYYELGFTLPGQRIGSSAWFNKLKGYLEEYGMTSDNGLPALFSKMPSKNGKGIILLTHVDDMELYASKEDFANLVEFLKSKGLKRKVEGPLDEKEGSIGFLKRNFKSTHEGDELIQKDCHVHRTTEHFKAKKGGMDPLSAEDHHTYRKGVGILLYLAPERPDVMYVLKQLSTKLAAPVEADMELLRYVGKYLKGTPELALIHKKSYPGKSFNQMRNRGTADEDVERDNYKVPALTEVISDSDWAADRESRQSVKRRKRAQAMEKAAAAMKRRRKKILKTAEELQQEAVMKGRLDDLAEMKEDAESRRAKVAEAANKVAEKAEETNEEAAAGKTEETAESRRAKVAEAANKVAEKAEETNEEAAAGKTEETDEEAAAGKAKETEEEAAAGKAKETDEEAEEAKDKEER